MNRPDRVVGADVGTIWVESVQGSGISRFDVFLRQLADEGKVILGTLPDGYGGRERARRLPGSPPPKGWRDGW